MRTVPVKTTTVDLATGAETTRDGRAHLMPPHKDACQICGHNPAHDPDEPHNAQSLYYQYSFYGEHGRWPTWADAIAHCPEPLKVAWEAELRQRGAWNGPQ